MVGERGRVWKIALPEFRQRVFVEQRQRQRQQGARLPLTRFHSRRTPDIDRRHNAGRRQTGDQAGARQRGFARTACAHDQQEGRAALLRPGEAPTRLVDRPASAKKYRGMFRLERRQPPKWRALLLWPCHTAAQETVALKPLPEQLFELLLKGVGAGEALECRLELPAL